LITRSRDRSPPPRAVVAVPIEPGSPRTTQRHFFSLAAHAAVTCASASAMSARVVLERDRVVVDAGDVRERRGLVGDARAGDGLRGHDGDAGGVETTS
jgi:hypothetical protein